MNTSELKNTLMTIKNNDFRIDASVSVSELTDAMLNEIGNIDPVLRDNLIYSSFCHFILNDFYSKEQLKRILDICQDNEHLFYKIGDVQDDSVFTRSFSSLIIAVILHINSQKNFLTSNDIEGVSDSLLTYLKDEQDIRGLVQEKGWAHSIAHVADALDELVKQPLLSKSRLEEICTAIIKKMCFNKDFFHFEEDERMVIPVLEMLRRDLNESVISDEVNRISDELKQNYFTGEPQLFIYRANIKQFLRSLYFQLEYNNLNAGLRNQIIQALTEINQPYYSN